MNSTGHMVLAQAAFSLMKPQTQAWLTQVVSDPDNPQDGGFQEADDTTLPGAATEPDDYKSWARRTHNGDDPKSYDHFYNMPVGDPKYTAGKTAGSPNGLDQLQQEISLVQAPSTDTGTRANAMRWILHLYGDIGAQPWHCVQFYNAQFPNGDGGANDIKASWGSTGKFDTDLHALADCGGAHPDPTDPSKSQNNYPFMPQPLSPANQQWIETKASALLAENPASSFTPQQLADQNPSDWVKDLSAQAEQMYPKFINMETAGPNTPPVVMAPDDPRLHAMEQLMDRNVSLAAHRLAALCDAIATSQAAGMAGPHATAAIVSQASLTHAPLAALTGRGHHCGDCA